MKIEKMKIRMVMLGISLLIGSIAQASEFKPLMGLNLGYGYLSAEDHQLDKKGLNLGAKIIGSWEFKNYFLDGAIGYQSEFLEANYVSIQNNTPTAELSFRKKLGRLSVGPMIQAQSGVYSALPSTHEPNKVINNAGIQMVYESQKDSPRFEISLLNSVGSGNMVDRNLTTLRIGIQIPFGSESKKEARTQPEKIQQSYYIPTLIVPGLVTMKRYILQTDNLGFKKKSYDLDSHSSAKLNKLAKFIVNNKIKIKKIEITGHADKLGSNSYNTKLSEKRAQVVKEIFINNKVDSQIIIVSEGKSYSEPMQGLSEKSVKNRRTEIEFIDVEMSDELNKKLNEIIN